MINICIIATIVIYLVGMLLVGFVYSKSNEDSSDFYLGGRTMGPLVTAKRLRRFSHAPGQTSPQGERPYLRRVGKSLNADTGRR